MVARGLIALALIGAFILATVQAFGDDIRGRGDDFRWGFGTQKQIVIQEIAITRPTVGATIVVGAEAANVREVSIDLTDADGTAITAIEGIELWVCLDATCTDFVATGGSTGIEEDASPAAGQILALVAKKVFLGRTDATGQLNLTWTDTGTEAAFLGVRLPNGRLVISAAMTNT